ncbi:F-box/kelch-repeat protein At3g06240-like [Lotus japonicus]|uniref:F-box/kelch-repeat protein At3g06240-like n=1 Tax=Lotus japonicus TaxID=34305 RepID=UPI00258E1C5A|nr:F-box/kelch-repeat protein At3g06240-like [Lotus japonicus]
MYPTGFGYDKSTDDYLLVLMMVIPEDYYPQDVPDFPTTIRIFSMKKNSWFNQEGTYAQYVDMGCADLKIAAFLNDALHLKNPSLFSNLPEELIPQILLRGFTLVAYECGNTIIWNPSTGSQRRIEGQDNLGEAMLEYLTGFGYDTSTDDYLLVLIGMMHFDREDYLRVGSYLNEALHWLVMSYDTKLEVIIAFDLVQHGLSEIPLSHNLARKLKHKPYYLRVLGECLSLCYLGNMDSMAEIWMMKKYKVRSSWTKVFAFSTCNIPKNVFFPICFTKHGEIFGSNGTGRLMILNDKGWLLDQCSLWPAPDRLQFIHVDCGMYRESLLSLPNDFEEASEDDQLTNALEEASKDDR